MRTKTWLYVVIGALGYFVDIYDLVLFGMVRIASLRDLGIAPEKLLDFGVILLNCQMAGLLFGGIVWGIFGDKKGRLSVLFGSILLYSIANLANAYVTNISDYAILRFVAGVGLAGELGAAITLVSEMLPKETRGYGTAIVAGVGLTGAIAAGITVEYVHWRTAYTIGGVLGLCLLVLRIGVLESTLFLKAKETNVARGEIKMLFTSAKRFQRFVYCILIGVPIWYVAGILMTFSPEISAALGISGVTAGKSIMYSYVGVALGDFLSGFLSQWIGSRRKVVIFSLLFLAVTAGTILSLRDISSDLFYILCFIIGLSTGYWAVFVTIAAEQFGTNLRSTVATSVPNLVRGSVILLTLLFRYLSHETSLIGSAAIVGALTVVVGLFAIFQLEETHGRDLNFIEEP